MSWKELFLQALQILRPKLHAKVVVTLLVAGVAAVTQPLWASILVAAINYSIPVQIESYSWTGWVLIAIALLIFFIGCWPEIISSIRSERKVHAKDIELYEKVNVEFFDSGVVDYLRDHDFTVDARKNVIDVVLRFSGTWIGPNYSFLNKELQAIWSEVRERGGSAC